jgi:hypothetical protein
MKRRNEVREIRSFVVRVYRRDAKGVWGVVQDVQNGCTHTFHTPEHLWTVLSAAPHEPPTEGRHE